MVRVGNRFENGSLYVTDVAVVQVVGADTVARPNVATPDTISTMQTTLIGTESNDCPNK